MNWIHWYIRHLRVNKLHWYITHFCHTCPPCSWHHRDRLTDPKWPLTVSFNKLDHRSTRDCCKCIFYSFPIGRAGDASSLGVPFNVIGNNDAVFMLYWMRQVCWIHTTALPLNTCEGLCDVYKHQRKGSLSQCKFCPQPFNSSGLPRAAFMRTGNQGNRWVVGQVTIPQTMATSGYQVGTEWCCTVNCHLALMGCIKTAVVLWHQWYNVSLGL